MQEQAAELEAGRRGRLTRHGWVWQEGAAPSLASQLPNALGCTHTHSSHSLTSPRSHLIPQVKSFASSHPPPDEFKMPLEAQLKGFVAECFTEPVATAITVWLEEEAVLGAEGFGLLAASETEVQANITDVAFTAKVHGGK